MLYDYECKKCGHEVTDVFQKVTEEPLKQCPNCKKNKLFRIVTGGVYASVRNITTIGQMADKNTKENKGRINEAEARKREENPPPELPHYHKYGSKTTKEITKMTEKQKIKYIMENK